MYSLIYDVLMKLMQYYGVNHPTEYKQAKLIPVCSHNRLLTYTAYMLTPHVQ